MKKIAVMTSGGDAPGMNAAVRAVVRTALAGNIEVYGVNQGFTGLIEDSFRPLGTRDVSNTIQMAGTILESSRCPDFFTEEGQLKALRHLHRRGIEGLVVIGGDGSQSGSFSLSQQDFPVVGVASTIDNDLYGSEITIGVDTALNIALEAIDRLKVTAASHQRAFLVEVMGRNSGYLALMTAIAGGAESVVIPERETSAEAVATELREAYGRGKAHALVVVAEGAHLNARRLEAYFQQNKAAVGFELRVTILGHVQRGGTPTAFDRLLATRLGAAAVEALAHGRPGVLMGLNKGVITAIPLAEVVSTSKQVDLKLVNLAEILAR